MSDWPSPTPDTHSTGAWKWMKMLPDDAQLIFCRYTQVGLLRLLTNARVMGQSAQTQAGAWKTYDILAGRNDVVPVDEPRNLDFAFRELSRSGNRSPNAWNDAYLGALSIAAGMQMVSFDAVFRSMPGVDAVVLTQAH